MFSHLVGRERLKIGKSIRLTRVVIEMSLAFEVRLGSGATS